MRIIIIGASGLIGNQLFKESLKNNKKVIGTYESFKRDGLIHFNMKDESLSSKISDLNSSDVVYLLAAYSNPSWIFNNIDTARQLNIISTKKLIDEISKIGCRLIFMSSVEVFDGANGNYIERSIPNPLNLYGEMKYEIENYLIENYPDNSCIVRTSWNVGWNLRHRCVVNLTYETLLSPNARMANDNTFSIADVRDTAKGLLRLSDYSEVKHCHLASTPKLVRSELADIVKNQSKFGDLMDFGITSFSEIPYSEPRAKHNSLDVSFAIKTLQLNFRNPKDIICEKVKLLDKHFDEIKNNN